MPPAASSSSPTSRSCSPSTERARAAACCSTWSIAATPSPSPTSTTPRVPCSSPGRIRTRPSTCGDGFLMRHGWVVISCGWQCDVPEIPGLLRLQAPEARGAGGAPAPRPRLHPAPGAADGDAISPVRSRAPRLPRRRPRRARRPAHRARPARRRSRGHPARALALRASGQRPRRPRRAPCLAGRRLREGPALPASPTPARARPCWGSAWRRCAKPCPGSSTAAPPRRNPAPGALRWAYAYGRSQTGRLLRTLRLRGPQSRRGGPRGDRRDHRQRRGRDAGRVQPALRAELEGPPAHDGAPLPVHRRARDRPDTGRKDALHARLDARGSRLQGVLHEHLGGVPPGRRLAHPHRSRRRA